MSKMERRQIERLPVFGRAYIRSTTASLEKQVPGQIYNISVSGMGIHTVDPLAVGSRVTIDIEFLTHERKGKGETIEGVIVWVMQQNGLYQMGVHFSEALSKEKQPHLFQHCRNAMKED